MSIFHDLMQKPIKEFAFKNDYELADSIQSKVIGFGFSLAEENELEFTSLHTKAALQRWKSKSKRLGWSHGNLSKVTKFTGKAEPIEALLDKKVSIRALVRILR